jgi:hypothetical protein
MDPVNQNALSVKLILQPEHEPGRGINAQNLRASF